MTQKEIFRRYDLKGSKLGREVLNTLPLEERNKEKFSFALKDLDFEHHKKRLMVKSEKKEALMLQLKNDTTFLKENDIIDYSFLVGFSTIETENNTHNNTRKPTLTTMEKKDNDNDGM